jgi:hypothetical protein
LSERYGLILEAYLQQGGVSTTKLVDCNNVVQMLLQISLKARSLPRRCGVGVDTVLVLTRFGLACIGCRR